MSPDRVGQILPDGPLWQPADKSGQAFVASLRVEVRLLALCQNPSLREAPPNAPQATRMLPAAMDRYRSLVRDLPATAARDPAVAGREALREVLGGASITLRPSGDGGVEAVMPLPSLSKLLNGLNNMSSGSGGVIWAVAGVPQSVRVK